MEIGVCPLFSPFLLLLEPLATCCMPGCTAFSSTQKHSLCLGWGFCPIPSHIKLIFPHKTRCKFSFLGITANFSCERGEIWSRISLWLHGVLWEARGVKPNSYSLTCTYIPEAVWWHLSRRPWVWLHSSSFRTTHKANCNLNLVEEETCILPEVRIPCYTVHSVFLLHQTLVPILFIIWLTFPHWQCSSWQSQEISGAGLMEKKYVFELVDEAVSVDSKLLLTNCLWISLTVAAFSMYHVSGKQYWKRCLNFIFQHYRLYIM